MHIFFTTYCKKTLQRHILQDSIYHKIDIFLIHFTPCYAHLSPTSLTFAFYSEVP